MIDSKVSFSDTALFQEITPHLCKNENLATSRKILQPANIYCCTPKGSAEAIDQLAIHSLCQKGLQGKYAFIAQQSPHKLDQLLMAGLLGNGDQAEGLVIAMKERLEALRKLYHTTQLQNGDFAYAKALPVAIAQALYTAEGKLNLTLVPLIKKHLLSDTTLTSGGKADPVDWQQQTSNLLEQLVRNRELSLLLEEPITPSPVGELLTRATLNICDPHVKICERDLAVCLLATLLGAVRQGPVSNCFVICNIIWFYTALLPRVIADLKQLLADGWLERAIDGRSCSFPFELAIADKELDKQIAREILNNSRNDSYPTLGDAPSMQAMATYFGVENIKAACKKILQDNPEAEIFTPRKMIDALVELSMAEQGGMTEAKTAGHLLFCSHTALPLLHAYAGSLAAIDESQRDDYLLEKISDCWQTTFAPLWRKLRLKNLDHGVVAKVKASLMSTLAGRIQCRYSEDVATSLGADGHSTAGSFRYYESDIEDNTHQATPIAEPQQLVDYALRSLKVTNQTLTKAIEENENERQACEKTLLKVEKFISVNRERFLLEALDSYDSDIKKMTTLEEKWKGFLSLSTIGGSNVNVFTKALGLPPPPSIAAGSHSAEARFITIVKFLRDMESKYRYIDPRDAVDTRFMVDSDQHAFTIQAENESILPWVQSAEPVDLLLKKWIYEPCSAAIAAPLELAQRQALEAIALSLSPQELHSHLQRQMDRIPSGTKEKLGSYSGALLQLLLAQSPPGDTIARGKISAKFSNKVLYEILTDQQLSLLQTKTISALDTNWQDYDSESGQILRIFFGFTLNPVTNKMEVFQINENGKKLNAMNQAEWVDGPWNLYDCHLTAV